MVEKINTNRYLEPSWLEPSNMMGNVDDQKRKLMNFACAMAKEEGLVVGMLMEVDGVQKRVDQRVMCLTRGKLS